MDYLRSKGGDFYVNFEIDMYILQTKIKYNSRIYLISGILLFLSYFYFTTTAYSTNVEFHFQWDANHPNDNVVEYRIYWRTENGYFNSKFSEVIPISNLSDPNNPEYILTLDLDDPTQIMYFACTAVDDEGFESDYANEGDSEDINPDEDINPNIELYESGGGCFVSTISH